MQDTPTSAQYEEYSLITLEKISAIINEIVFI